jgi:hypothetical protein
MKNVNFFDDVISIKIDELDRSSTQDSTLIPFSEERIYKRLPNKSLSYIFPLLYFFTSTIFLFIILFVNVFKDTKIRYNFEKLPLHPFPGFITLKHIQPTIYAASILCISISGFLNSWFFCSLLLQRFSVPELRKHKLTIHLMFILGIFSNVIYIFFGFSPHLLKIESENIKIVNVSLSMIIFLSFVFFNILFATLTLHVFEIFRKQIACNDKRLKRNTKVKKYMLCLAIFILFIYLMSIFLKFEIKNNFKGLKENKSFKQVVQFFLFIVPYILFVFNALINLTYYLDIRYLEDIINRIIDKEFFMTNEEGAISFLSGSVEEL